MLPRFQAEMLTCESCGDALSTTAGKRPVSFCDHILCESCVSDDGSCPLCNLKTDLTGDDRVSRDLLKLTAKAHGSVSKNAKYPCDHHGENEMKFVCCEHKAALCADCAWNHRDHENRLIRYSSTDVHEDLLLARGILDNHINHCQEMRKSASENVTRGEVFAFMEKMQRTIMKVSEEKCLRFRLVYNFDSIILEVDQVWRISNMCGEIKEMKLLYRASKDGDSADQFHERCDDKGPTLVVVSAKGKTFGGFATASWASPDRGTWHPGDTRNFLFHLDPDFVLRCVDGSQYGTGSDSSCGPVFGRGCALGISDGCLSNTDSYCGPSTEYPTSDENQLKCIKDLGDFQVTDYEVFSVVV